MTDEVENLVLEQLRLIRAPLQKVEFDVADLKVRLSMVETNTGQVITSLGALNARMDRFDERLSRVEKRLALIDA
jgi:hypothetical protein